MPDTRLIVAGGNCGCGVLGSCWTQLECGCSWDHGQVFPCEAHQQYGASPLDEDRIPLPASVGEVLLDYSVRAETAAGALRNALQICEDADVARLIRVALDKIETRGAPPPQHPHTGT